jgi:hypothetical protein
MKPRYRVTLTEQERQELESLTKKAKTNAKQFFYARALPYATRASGASWKVADTAEAMGVTPRTIKHLKKRFVEEGLAASLERRKPETTPRDAMFDGASEARLIVLACSEAPHGRRRWSVRLLAEKAVELNLAKSVSHITSAVLPLSTRPLNQKRPGGTH